MCCCILEGVCKTVCGCIKKTFKIICCCKSKAEKNEDRIEQLEERIKELEAEKHKPESVQV